MNNGLAPTSTVEVDRIPPNFAEMQINPEAVIRLTENVKAIWDCIFDFIPHHAPTILALCERLLTTPQAIKRVQILETIDAILKYEETRSRSWATRSLDYLAGFRSPTTGRLSPLLDLQDSTLSELLATSLKNILQKA